MISGSLLILITLIIISEVIQPFVQMLSHYQASHQYTWTCRDFSDPEEYFLDCLIPFAFVFDQSLQLQLLTALTVFSGKDF